MALYPRHVHMRGGVYRVTVDADDYARAIAEGWTDQPPSGPQPTVYREWVPGMPGPEMAPVPKRRGRPPKETPPSES